jgi:hypothetical protein
MKTLGLILLLALALSVPPAAWAQSPTASHGGRSWSDIQSRLHLSAEQATRLRPMIEDFYQRQKSLWASFRGRVHKVMTPEQNDLFSQFRTSLREHQVEFGSITSRLGLKPDQLNAITKLHDECVAQSHRNCEKLLEETRAVLSADQQSALASMLTHK